MNVKIQKLVMIAQIITSFVYIAVGLNLSQTSVEKTSTNNNIIYLLIFMAIVSIIISFIWGKFYSKEKLIRKIDEEGVSIYDFEDSSGKRSIDESDFDELSDIEQKSLYLTTNFFSYSLMRISFIEFTAVAGLVLTILTSNLNFVIGLASLAFVFKFHCIKLYLSGIEMTEENQVRKFES